MFAAKSLLNGVIGVASEPAGDEHCYIEEGTPLIIIGSRGTNTRELEGYQCDIVEAYRQRQAMEQAQG